MAQAKMNMQHLTQAISGIQQLRSTVMNVFSLLCEGVKPDEEEDGKNEEAENSVSVGKDGKKFLHRFQEYLEAVNKDYNEVEKSCNNMTSMTELQPLGPSGPLSLDSIADKNCTYRDVVLTYQWNNRLHEYAQIASSIMLSSHLKRSQVQAGNVLAKRRRIIPPKFLSLSNQQVEATIQSLDRQLSDFTIKLVQTSGDTRILHVTVGKVFVAIIVLRSLMIEKVLIRGLDENWLLENNNPDLFTKSQYECMRRITDHAMSAVLQYTSQASVPEFPVKYIMFWLHSYKSLFTDACTVCSKYMDNDGLPPLWRDYRNPGPCHESCRP